MLAQGLWHVAIYPVLPQACETRTPSYHSFGECLGTEASLLHVWQVFEASYLNQQTSCFAATESCVVCTLSWVVCWQSCDMSKPTDPLMLNMMVDALCSYHFSDFGVVNMSLVVLPVCLFFCIFLSCLSKNSIVLLQMRILVLVGVLLLLLLCLF